MRESVTEQSKRSVFTDVAWRYKQQYRRAAISTAGYEKISSLTAFDHCNMCINMIYLIEHMFHRWTYCNVKRSFIKAQLQDSIHYV